MSCSFFRFIVPRGVAARGIRATVYVCTCTRVRRVSSEDFSPFDVLTEECSMQVCYSLSITCDQIHSYIPFS